MRKSSLCVSAIAVTLAFAACRDSRIPTEAEVGPLRLSTTGEDVPPRDNTSGGEWAAFSDSELWSYIARADSVAHIGLKAVGATRGVYKGRRLLTAADWDAGKAAVLSLLGTRLVLSDTTYSVLRVRIPNQATLTVLRRVPHVDYVEPSRLLSKPGFPLLADFGCTATQWTGAYPYEAGYNPGDVMSKYFQFDYMAVQDAWRRSTGAGVTIGLVDTGVDPNQTQLTSGFAAGSSGGRWYRYMDWTGNTEVNAWTDRCNHGTRLEGVAAAPNDGTNIVGTAWRANIVSVRHHDAVNIDPIYEPDYIDAYQASQAMLRASDNGAKIIATAWGSDHSYSAMSDVIDDLHYNRGVLFVGAAGTSKCEVYLDWAKSIVVFPARKAEVMAVTGADYAGARSCESHYGSEVEIAAQVYHPTTGAVTKDGFEIVTMSGSSNAVGVIVGVGSPRLVTISVDVARSSEKSHPAVRQVLPHTLW